jgi:hypothetical protein
LIVRSVEDLPFGVAIVKAILSWRDEFGGFTVANYKGGQFLICEIGSVWQLDFWHPQIKVNEDRGRYGSLDEAMGVAEAQTKTLAQLDGIPTNYRR